MVFVKLYNNNLHRIPEFGRYRSDGRAAEGQVLGQVRACHQHQSHTSCR